MSQAGQVANNSNKKTSKVYNKKKLPKDKKEVSQMAENWKKWCERLSRLMKVCPGLDYKIIPQHIFDIVQHSYSIDGGNLIESLRFNNMAHEDKLMTFLYIDMVHDLVEWRMFDLYQQKLQLSKHPTTGMFYLRLTLPGISKGWPPISWNDTILLEQDGHARTATINTIQHDDILFLANPNENALAPFLSLYFDVAFFPGPKRTIRVKKAIDELTRRPELYNLLRCKHTDATSSEPKLAKTKINLLNTNTHHQLVARIKRLGGPQQHALVKILEAKCRPNPHLVIGGPGTGKTTLLVEAVVNIYLSDETANILVSTTTNECADQLVELIEATKLVPSMERIRSQIKKDTNARIPGPTVKSRVVVTTNMMSATIFKTQFDYLFIDEAPYVREPEILMPIMQLKPDGFLVLFGDPNQLAAPIKLPNLIKKLGLHSSLFERLLKQQMYMPKRRTNPSELTYDEHLVSNLTVSFRCDPRLMEILNKSFYNGRLECLGKTPLELMLKMMISVPTVFHAIKGKEVASDEHPQYRYNKAEAQICAGYVIKLKSYGLKSSQIGIITENKLQKNVIEQELRQSSPKPNGSNVRPDTKRREANGFSTKSDVRIGEPQGKSRNKLLSLISKLFYKSLWCPPGPQVMVPTQTAYERLPDRRRDSGCSTRELSREVASSCKVDVLNKFLGVEKEVIIISTVRTTTKLHPNTWGSDFSRDAKKFATAIGRAKWLVIVVGHPCMQTGLKHWTDFIKDAKRVEGSVAMI